MKRILFVLAVAVLLLIPMAVFAHGGSPPRPPQPTCPEGYNTEKEAEWVEGTPATAGYCHVVVRGIDMSQYYKHDGNSANCSLKNSENWRKFFCPYPPTTAQGSWVPGTPATDGYWTEPVCELPPPPVEGCTDSKALNYDPEAEVDDGTCEYPPPPVCEWDESIPADDPGCEFCLIFPEDELCKTPPPVCEWDETIPADDPGCEFCLFFPEDETCKTPPPSKKKVCEPDEIGRLFELKSETGQSCWLASYQRHPLTGDWALPRIEEQLCQCGFIAVDVDDHEDIVRDCNGDVNIQTVHLSCIGGAGGGSCN